MGPAQGQAAIEAQLVGRQDLGHFASDEPGGLVTGPKRPCFLGRTRSSIGMPAMPPGVINCHGLAGTECGLLYAESYGPLGTGLILVHNVVPSSELGPVYELHPTGDMSPVCPNCHSMLYKRRPLRSLGVLSELTQTVLTGHNNGGRGWRRW